MENARPTPLWALELPELPTDHHFRRDHFGVPELDPAGRHPLGRRRGEALWTGVPLRELLALARPSRRAAAVVLEGADRGPFAHLAGEFSFARCLPLAKALDRDTLLAWQMNGAPLPAAHGAPLRAVVPGWYATDSVKWLVRIELIEGEYDGPFEALDYRLGDDRLTELPVHALVTSPAEGAEVAPGPLDVGGVAWGGRGGVKAVEVRIDGGDWGAAACDPPAGPYALTRWRARVELTPGGRTIAVRATDGAGRSQPEVASGRSACHHRGRVDAMFVSGILPCSVSFAITCRGKAGHYGGSAIERATQTAGNGPRVLPARRFGAGRAANLAHHASREHRSERARRPQR